MIASRVVTLRALGHNREGQVAVGHHPHGAVVLADDHRADVAVAHELGDAPERVAHVHAGDGSGHQLADAHAANIWVS